MEYECNDPNYRDTFHPARIVAINYKKQTATVKYIAFDKEPLGVDEEFARFHPYRGAQPNYPYCVGDRVHFRMFKRKVHGRRVDGHAGEEEGVWVKGTIVKIYPQKGEFMIRHVDWDEDERVYIESRVCKQHIRPE